MIFAPMHGGSSIEMVAVDPLDLQASTGTRLGPMTDKAIDLDQHRGMAAQKATDLRRFLAEVAANERALRAAQDGPGLELARGR